MSSGPDRGAPRIEVEKPGGSGWGKIAVMAAVGFAVGVFWPRLFGMRPGPSAPPETVGSAEATQENAPLPAAVVAHSPLPSAPVAAALAVPAAPPPSAAAPSAPVSVTVGRGYSLSCRSSDGSAAKGAACGAIGGIDSVFVPRLRKLAQCGSAGGATGKLQVVVSLDFDRSSVGLEVGKGSTVADPEALTACAKTAIHGAAIAPITHDQSRYAVLYSVNFGSPATEPTHPGATTSASRQDRVAATNPAPPPAGGSAQVIYETGIVRDAPHKSGKVVSRLTKGTEVHVGAAQDGWYEVHFGPDFATQGWLFGGAIGK